MVIREFAERPLVSLVNNQLADAARIGVATVRLFESEATETRQATLAVLRQAFEFAGVEFTNGDQPGVRLTTRLLLEGDRFLYDRQRRGCQGRAFAQCKTSQIPRLPFTPRGFRLPRSLLKFYALAI
jgi:hypothetical protein